RALQRVRVPVLPFFWALLQGFSGLRDLHSFPTRRSSDLLLFPLAFLIVSFAKLVSTKVLRLPYAYKEPAHALINLSSLSKYSRRSEEHTSELQSVKISYAVFCLKKKKHDFPGPRTARWGP